MWVLCHHYLIVLGRVSCVCCIVLLLKEACLVLWVSKPVFLVLICVHDCVQLLIVSMIVFSCSVLSGSLQAHQAPLSMWFSRQEYWCGLPFPSPGDLPNPGNECVSPTLAGRVFCIFFFNHLASREAQLKGISHISFSYLQSLSGINYSIIYFVPLLCLCQKRVTWFGAKSSF